MFCYLGLATLRGQEAPVEPPAAEPGAAEQVDQAESTPLPYSLPSEPPEEMLIDQLGVLDEEVQQSLKERLAYIRDRKDSYLYVVIVDEPDLAKMQEAALALLMRWSSTKLLGTILIFNEEGEFRLAHPEVGDEYFAGSDFAASLVRASNIALRIKKPEKRISSLIYMVSNELVFHYQIHRTQHDARYEQVMETFKQEYQAKRWRKLLIPLGIGLGLLLIGGIIYFIRKAGQKTGVIRFPEVSSKSALGGGVSYGGYRVLNLNMGIAQKSTSTSEPS